MKQKANKSAREPSAKPRKVVDWSLVKREYEVGQFSIREIARQFGVSDMSVRRKIKSSLVKYAASPTCWLIASTATLIIPRSSIRKSNRSWVGSPKV